MLTGRVPFDGDRPVTVAMKQINEPPIPPRVFESNIPQDLDAVVMKALSKRPEDRFETAEDFTTALLDVRAGMSGGQQSTLILTAPTAVAGAAAATGETQAMPANGGGRNGGGGRRPAKKGNNRPAVWGLVAVLIAALAVALALALTSGGGDTIPVPDVAGLDVPAATKQITDAGLKPQQRQQTSDTVAAGVVIGSNPSAGTDVAKESTVTILVSTGAAEVTVPSVLNMTVEEATAALEKVGMVVTTVEVDSTKDIGTVVKQDPKPGVTAKAGDTVTLSVSKGTTKVTAPDVTGSTLDTAKADIVQAGLTVGSVSEDDGTSGQTPGTVVSQDPSGGSSVPKGSAVDLVVAAQSSGQDVPDVTGSDAATAKSKLSSLGFNVVSQGAESTQPEGTVIDQDPQPGATIAAGGTVTIIVAYPASSGGTSGGTTTRSGGSSGGGSSGGSQPPAPSSSGGTGAGGSAGGGGSQPPAP